MSRVEREEFSRTFRTHSTLKGAAQHDQRVSQPAATHSAQPAAKYAFCVRKKEDSDLSIERKK